MFLVVDYVSDIMYWFGWGLKSIIPTDERGKLWIL